MLSDKKSMSMKSKLKSSEYKENKSLNTQLKQSQLNFDDPHTGSNNNSQVYYNRYFSTA